MLQRITISMRRFHIPKAVKDLVTAWCIAVVLTAGMVLLTAHGLQPIMSIIAS